jgi:hypothetical protein
MPKSEETPFDTYLQTVLAHLPRLTPAQRAVIQAELEAHLADAAQERGGRPDDPALQAAVITELGPAKRLGKTWAQTYRSWEGTMHGSQKVVFWGLWVLASTIGWAHGSYDATPMWQLPFQAMVGIALQSLILRGVAGVRWWWPWLLVSLVPWLILMGLYVTVLQPGAMTDLAFLFSLQLPAMAVGVGQWLVLRRHVTLAGLWITVPPLGLAVALMTSSSLNVALIARPVQVARLGGWQEAHLLVELVYGATQGIVTGSILLGLLSLRAFGQAQRSA